MAKQIEQHRWDYVSNKNDFSDSDFVTGNKFTYPIAQLGIQTLPGVVFYLNGNTHALRTGASGIFDLETKEGARINKLQFSEESIKRINNGRNYLIVDILHEGREEG